MTIRPYSTHPMGNGKWYNSRSLADRANTLYITGIQTEALLPILLKSAATTTTGCCGKIMAAVPQIAWGGKLYSQKHNSDGTSAGIPVPITQPRNYLGRKVYERLEWDTQSNQQLSRTTYQYYKDSSQNSLSETNVTDVYQNGVMFM